MDEKRYLIEILLEARERVSAVAQKVAQQLDKVAKAQDDVGDSTRRMTAAQRQEYEVLQQLVAAHTREKKALEDSAAVLRFRANARAADAAAARKSLEALQSQANLERALAGERKKRDAEQVASLRLEVAQREAATAARTQAYQSETDDLRRRAQLVEAQSRQDAEVARKRAVEQNEYIAVGKQIVSDLQAQSRTEAAVATEREKRDIEELTRLRQLVAERNAAEGKKDKAFNAETARLRKQAALIDATALAESAANRRRAADIGVQIDSARRELQALQEVASSEQALNSERERAHSEEIARIKREVAERESASTTEANANRAQIDRLKEQASLLEKQASAESSINERRASELNLQIAQIKDSVRERERAASVAESAARDEERAATSSGRALDKHTGALERLISRTSGAEAANTRLGRTFERLGINTGALGTSLRGLNSEFQGFQLAAVIKYAQSLLSVLVSLGAQLVAVAAAAGQAAISLGAAFGAAAAQAIPVVGVLAAAFGRLTAVLKAVKLQNQQQLADTHNTETAARRQTSAADQIRNAQQQVADAHRGVARAVADLARTQADASRQEVQAQRDVTQARKDAIRTVQDLIAAERDAQVQLLQAQASLRGSIQSGDVLGTLAAFDAQTAARRGVTRARQDAAPVRARGVEGVPAVQQAEQRVSDVRRTNAQQIASAEQQVSDAQRTSRRAEQDLARTRVESTQNIAQETAAADKLTNSIKLLSPAEQHLYRRILVLQDTYKRAVRPITDIITRAFSGVVDRANQLLQDPKLMRGFRNIAVQIAASIKSGLGEATGPRSIGLFEQLQREAAHNIPTVTRIIKNLFGTVRDLIRDALPAFRVLLGFVDGYAGSLRKAVEAHPKQITDFFVSGVKTAESFFKLGLSFLRLLLTIAGKGGAAHEGKRTIDDLTQGVDDLTGKANKNAGKIRKFFDQTHDAAFEVIGVLGAIAKAAIGAFNAGSVKTFADFLKQVIIPAVSTVVQIMGVMVSAFHSFATLPGVSQALEVLATILLGAKGLDIIHHAVSSLFGILPNFLKSFGLLVPVIDEATGAVTGFELAIGGPWLIAIALVIGAIILLNKHFHFLGPTLKWLKGAAGDVFDWLKKAADSVVSWFKDVWNKGLLKWIRQPYVDAFNDLKNAGVFRWVIGAAKTVIDFFSSKQQGGWGLLKDLMLVPFHAFKGALKIAFDIIKGIVKVFLDVLAGRFGAAGTALKDMFKGVVDTIAGGASSLLDIMSRMVGIGSKIPGVGGLFKGIAKEIGGARDAIDKYRESLHDHKDKQDKSNDSVKKALPNLVSLKNRYDDASDRLSKLNPNTDAYRQAAKKADDVSRNYNAALKDTANKADGARPSVKTLKTNIGQLGDVSADTAKAIAENLNDVLKQVGAKTIKLNTQAYKRSGIDQMTATIGHGATGGVLSRALGLRNRLYGGGIANPYGGAADDHVLYSPTGAPVAALSGTEGIINRPQMGVIDHALGFANAMGAVPWRSLNDLWGSGMRHYAAGGKLQLPTNFRATHQTAGLAGYPAVDVFGKPGEQVGSPIGGRVVKLSGRPPSAGAYEGAGGPFGWSEYISGGGRTYFLTHFGSRSVSLGQRVRRGQTIGTVGDYPGATPDHIHEGLHGAGMAVTGTGFSIPTIRGPRITGDDVGVLGRLARASSRVLAQAANAYLARNISQFGAGDVAGMGVGDFRGGNASGNGSGLMRQIARRRGWNFNDWWSIDARETGHGTNLSNPTSTARLRGQFLSSNWGKYGPGSDPRRSPSMAQQIQSMAQYISERYVNPTRAWAHERQFGWYKRGGPLRRLQTGGPIKGVARGPVPIPRARTNPMIASSFGASLDLIASMMGTITGALNAVTRRSLRHLHNLTTGIASAFDKLAGQDGVLDKMQAAVESIAAHGAVRLQQLQFRVTRGGPRRTYVSPVGIAQDNLQTLQATRTGLTDERGVLQGSLADAQRSLNEAQRRHNARAATAARAAISNLRQRIEKNAADLAQNAQDQVEAQEAFQQALLDSVNEAADQQNSAIDRWSRVAAALGHKIDPNVVLGAQVSNMQNQIGGLQDVLAQALGTGNLDLAKTVRGQIDDLNTQITEAVAQQFQNAIDAVNNDAQSALAANDRAARRAQIGGANYAALGNSLVARGNILANQRAGLAGLLAQAQASGNIDQAKSLTDQIDELDTAIAENTQAVKDNTDAAFNATTQAINDRQSFTQSFFGGVSGFLQAFTARTGISTTSQQAAALQATGSGLSTQHTGLVNQLGALLGYTPDEIAHLQTLSGPDLVSFLSSIAAGPAFDAIMARLDPTQQAAFKELISGLVDNATATEQNTQALQDLTGNNAQSFSSSFWTNFRTAVFTGSGTLLPQYAMTIPGADVGARVMQSGALMVHAGETVRPASINRNWRGGEGDTYNLEITTPTEVLDPVDVNRQLSFLRRTSGR